MIPSIASFRPLVVGFFLSFSFSALFANLFFLTPKLTLLVFLFAAAFFSFFAAKAFSHFQFRRHKTLNQASYIKQLERQLLEKQTRLAECEQELDMFSLLFDSMPDVIVLKDANGRSLFLNQTAKQAFSLQGDDVQGLSYEEMAARSLHHGDLILACREADESAWALKETLRRKEKVSLPDGGHVIFDSLKIPVFHADGSRKVFLDIARDITSIQDRERLLRESEKLSVLGRLAAGIAHEIRNPLTTVKGFVQLAQSGAVQLEDHLDLLSSELDHMNGIIGELLLVARPQEGTVADENVNQLVRDVLLLLSPEAALHNAQVTLHERGEFDMACFASEIKQVFINVLQNAFDAVTGKGQITVTLYPKNSQFFAVLIEDNGCGMDVDRLSHIGEPFYSVHEKGIGLGMTISSRILHDHGGSMRITSEVGKGTAVELLLPRTAENVEWRALA